jgi:serine acetyltransferase
METLIEKDSPRIPLLVLTAIFFLIIGSGIALAYMGGVFTGKDAVIANDLRIKNQARLQSAPETAKP